MTAIEKVEDLQGIKFVTWQLNKDLIPSWYAYTHDKKWLLSAAPRQRPFKSWDWSIKCMLPYGSKKHCGRAKSKKEAVAKAEKTLKRILNNNKEAI
jgi:hypothetical protein